MILIIYILGFIFKVSWSFNLFIFTPLWAQLSYNCTNTPQISKKYLCN